MPYPQSATVCKPLVAIFSFQNCSPAQKKGNFMATNITVRMLIEKLQELDPDYRIIRNGKFFLLSDEGDCIPFVSIDFDNHAVEIIQERHRVICPRCKCIIVVLVVNGWPKVNDDNKPTFECAKCFLRWKYKEGAPEELEEAQKQQPTQKAQK